MGLFADLNLLQSVCVTGLCFMCHCEESVELVDASTICVCSTTWLSLINVGYDGSMQ